MYTHTHTHTHTHTVRIPFSSLTHIHTQVRLRSAQDEGGGGRLYAMRIFRLDEEDTRLTLLKELHALMRCKDRAVLELEDAFLVPPARSPPPRERVHGRAPGPCVVLIKEPFLGSLREVGNGGALPVAVAAKDATRMGSWRLFRQRSLRQDGVHL